ncbi:MAG: 4Fe-4S double cluster binding domain-containing protein [Bacteroidales bacterium]
MTDAIIGILKNHLLPAENHIYGFADLTGLLLNKFVGFNYGISIGYKLDNKVVDKIINGPTPEYYSHYRQINEYLAMLTKNISEDLNKNDIETLNIDPTVSTSELDSIYFRTLRTDLSHKVVATRAGLGWIGKTDLFISRKFGPRLRLVSILLKIPVKPKSDPINKSLCGSCNICVDICPAKAANGKLWDITVDRDEFYDPWKCRDQCTEFGRTRLGIDARICGICVAACPVGQKKNVMS